LFHVCGQFTAQFEFVNKRESLDKARLMRNYLFKPDQALLVQIKLREFIDIIHLGLSEVNRNVSLIDFKPTKGSSTWKLFLIIF
jgi:hypothetical protein